MNARTMLQDPSDPGLRARSRSHGAPAPSAARRPWHATAVTAGSLARSAVATFRGHSRPESRTPALVGGGDAAATDTPADRVRPPHPWRSAVVRAVANTLFAALTRRQVVGAEHVPADGPCLLVVNHLSKLDPPLLLTVLPRRDLSALVAADFRRRPVHRVLIEAAGGTWIRRGAGDRVALDAALDLLAQGRIVGIAPEGRCSPTGALIMGKPGPALLAARANVPVLPVAVTGTERVVPALKRLRRATLTVRFGEPFRLPPLEPANQKQQLRAGTDLIMCRIAALLPPEYRGVYADHPLLKALTAA